MGQSKICDFIITGGSSRNKALKEIYNDELIRKSIYRTVLNSGGNSHDALEVFQEAIILFDKNIRENKFDRRSKESTYIISLGKYIWLNKRRNNLKVSYTDNHTHLDRVEEENPEKSIIDNEVAHKINDLLKDLGEKCYQVLKLWKESIPMVEITEILGFSSYNAARKQKYRCMKKLKHLFWTNTHLKRFFNN